MRFALPWMRRRRGRNGLRASAAGAALALLAIAAPVALSPADAADPGVPDGAWAQSRNLDRGTTLSYFRSVENPSLLTSGGRIRSKFTLDISPDDLEDRTVTIRPREVPGARVTSVQAVWQFSYRDQDVFGKDLKDNGDGSWSFDLYSLRSRTSGKGGDIQFEISYEQDDVTAVVPSQEKALAAQCYSGTPAQPAGDFDNGVVVTADFSLSYRPGGPADSLSRMCALVENEKPMEQGYSEKEVLFQADTRAGTAQRTLGIIPFSSRFAKVKEVRVGGRPVQAGPDGVYSWVSLGESPKSIVIDYDFDYDFVDDPVEYPTDSRACPLAPAAAAATEGTQGGKAAHGRYFIDGKESGVFSTLLCAREPSSNHVSKTTGDGAFTLEDLSGGTFRRSYAIDVTSDGFKKLETPVIKEKPAAPEGFKVESVTADGVPVPKGVVDLCTSTMKETTSSHSIPLPGREGRWTQSLETVIDGTAYRSYWKGDECFTAGRSTEPPVYQASDVYNRFFTSASKDGSLEVVTNRRVASDADGYYERITLRKSPEGRYLVGQNPDGTPTLPTWPNGDPMFRLKEGSDVEVQPSLLPPVSASEEDRYFYTWSKWVRRDVYGDEVEYSFRTASDGSRIPVLPDGRNRIAKWPGTDQEVFNVSQWGSISVNPFDNTDKDAYYIPAYSGRLTDPDGGRRINIEVVYSVDTSRFTADSMRMLSTCQVGEGYDPAFGLSNSIIPQGSVTGRGDSETPPFNIVHDSDGPGNNSACTSLQLVPKAPVLVPAGKCGTEPQVEIPEGVTGYSFRQVREGSKLTVTAVADAGFVLADGAQTRWEFDLTPEPCVVTVVPVDPVVARSQTCGVQDSVTLPQDPVGYTYEVTEGEGTVTVKAQASEGYGFGGGATEKTWVLDVEKRPCPFSFTKTDSAGGSLAGAQFNLESVCAPQAQGCTSKQVALAAQDSRFSAELQPGDYLLTEVRAPEGYVLLSRPVRLTVQPGGKVETADVTALRASEDGALSVVNYRAGELPSAGGSGTAWLALALGLGGAVGTGVYVLKVRRRS